LYNDIVDFCNNLDINVLIYLFLINGGVEMEKAKKQVFLGLIGGIMMFTMFNIAPFVYFIMIFLRIKKKNININVANWTFIILWTLHSILFILIQKYRLVGLIELFALIYFYFILIKKKTIFNIKAFTIAMFLLLAFTFVLNVDRTMNPIINPTEKEIEIWGGNHLEVMKSDTSLMIKGIVIPLVLSILQSISYLLIIPYFNNYYLKLKELNMKDE